MGRFHFSQNVCVGRRRSDKHEIKRLKHCWMPTLSPADFATKMACDCGLPRSLPGKFIHRTINYMR
jgi:hypothetical protein